MGRKKRQKLSVEEKAARAVNANKVQGAMQAAAQKMGLPENSKYDRIFDEIRARAAKAVQYVPIARSVEDSESSLKEITDSMIHESRYNRIGILFQIPQPTPKA